MSKSRAGSASMETRMLRDTVTRLEEELMCSQAEQKKIMDQLNCLIMLVKKAWSGDRSAAIHVANIVGAAPPDMDNDATEDIQMAAAAKPKSRALNNWAVLTIGLLNREYRILEQELASRQRAHLQLRQQFLEEELLQQRDLLLKQELRGTDGMRGMNGNAISTQGPVRRNSAHKQMISAEDRPATGKRKPAVRHLYRPATREAARDPLTVTDLFVGSTSNMANSTNKAMDGLYQLGPLDTGSGDAAYDDQDQDRQDLHYADPKRYSMFGLFDSDMGPNAASKRGRPPSGKVQRQSDNMRARPKSAAVPSGRPLKYETTKPIFITRPVSGHPSSRAATAAPSKPRAKSASAKLLHASASLPDQTLGASNLLPSDLRATASHGQIHNDLRIYEESEIGDQETRWDREPRIQVNIKKAESVVRFEEDLHNMAKMEDDFRQTTVELQRKLGIAPSGIVF